VHGRTCYCDACDCDSCYCSYCSSGSGGCGGVGCDGGVSGELRRGHRQVRGLLFIPGRGYRVRIPEYRRGERGARVPVHTGGVQGEDTLVGAERCVGLKLTLYIYRLVKPIYIYIYIYTYK